MPDDISQGHGATRRAVLDLLKTEGPMPARALATSLGLSAMAVRLHLHALRDQGLIEPGEERRGSGRPAQLWQLTGQAARVFPDAHADLSLSLLDAMKQAFGEEGLDRIVARRAEQQIEAYRAAIGDGATLAEKVERLAEVRAAEGYMAVVSRDDAGELLLVERHCPICSAARACSGLCRSELEVFRAVLGAGVEVKRTDHIISGDQRCAYRVRAVGEA